METKNSYLTDIISGTLVRATPEEIHAVQVFSKILVEDYGYPKAHIQTHPQWRVRIRPSDTRKEYPVDIAVFATDKKENRGEHIIVECKKPNRKDGQSQLEDYLRFSRANIGVWFNGQERLFLQKTESDGEIHFVELPNIPKYGERLEDIGLYKRKDLKVAHNLKNVFRSIRNYLAANAVGITRDEVFAQQMINLIFCKIYDERFTKSEDTVHFRAGAKEDINSVRERIEHLFERVKLQYSDVIDSDEKVLLDDNTLVHSVGALQIYCLMESKRDAIAEAFETFIGPSLKGGQGQFFTPRNVVGLIVGMVNPGAEEKLIDPACGSGGFLVDGLRFVWKRIEDAGAELRWPDQEIYSEKQKAAIHNFRGLDKDSFLSKVAKAYMAILGDGRGGVFCENSLDDPKKWSFSAQEQIGLGQFDVVVTNPPFGKKLRIDETSLLSSYELGQKWQRNRSNGVYAKTTKLQEAQSPQILFIERCLEFLKPGGRLGIITPESMFCNPNHRYIVQYIKSVARIRVVISLPEELFQPYTHAKTCVVVIEKRTGTNIEDEEIFMAVARWCGHDSRGLEIPHDDIPKIQKRYEEYRNTGTLEYDRLGFIVLDSQTKDDIYLPKYYNPEIVKSLGGLKETHDLVNFGDMVSEGVVEVSSGHEVGKLAYGTGDVPFIRTSDIANWEIKMDPKHGLSEDLYEAYRERQDVRENDILMVRDGTYLVGTCALITRLDTKIVYQSHILKIRSIDHDIIHPYLLLAVLSSPIVKEQIYAKRFTQDIIDTLGRRIHEIILPIPKKASVVDGVVRDVGRVVEGRITAREIAHRTVLDVAPTDVRLGREFGFLTIGR